MASQDNTDNSNLPLTFKSVECPEPVEGLCFVYILFCRNGSFYVGKTRDLKKRLEIHRQGFGARVTLQLKDFTLVWVEGPMPDDNAVKRERQLKKWSRAKKIALIQGDFRRLHDLSRSRVS